MSEEENRRLKTAWTISRLKFEVLSTGRQHEYLAWLARSAREQNRWSEFQPRCDELHSWAAIDRYRPPKWLTPGESLEEYVAFHSLFTHLPVEPSGDMESQRRPVSWQPRFDILVVMDQVRSPFNVGSVLRLIDNFGFRGLVHASSWVRLDHPQLKKAARSCEGWIPVDYVEDLPRFLSESHVPVIGVENEKTSLPVSTWKAPSSCCLVIGNETYGISEAILAKCRELVAIPLFGYKRSMNVHHALAVVAAHVIATLNAEPHGDDGSIISDFLPPSHIA